MPWIGKYQGGYTEGFGGGKWRSNDGDIKHALIWGGKGL